MVQKSIKFTKMHGAGNDYVYIDAVREPAMQEMDIKELEQLAVNISNRHFGVGSDGMVMIMPSEKADFRMRMFNADGSEAEMCGNASRCIGKYLYEKGLTNKTEIRLETKAGIKVLQLKLANHNDKTVESVTVDMGEPIVTPAQVPAVSKSESMMLMEEVPVAGHKYKITAVSMGNPHAIIFSEELTDDLVWNRGKKIEVSDIFPRRTNVEFVKVLAKDKIEMRVWERGSGETLACGTGACASAVACILAGKTERDIHVSLLGGDLKVKWDQVTNHVFLTGGAEFIADGIYFYNYQEDKK